MCHFLNPLKKLADNFDQLAFEIFSIYFAIKS